MVSRQRLSMYTRSAPLPPLPPLQATGFTGRHFFFVLTSLVLVCGRTMLLHTLREQRGDAASAGYGRTGGMSSSRCKCSWSRITGTEQGEERGEARDVLHGRVLVAPPPQASQPPCLGEPRGPQERIQQRTMEQLADVEHMVQILDTPVPQMVEQLPDVMRFFDTLLPVPEQAFEVPKVVLDDVPVRTSVCDTQLVEQRVEVPTIISYSSLRRTTEQHVDIPVPRRGGRHPGLRGFLPRQSSTATPSSKKRISERIVEQIVGIPGGGLQDFRPGQSSSSSSHVPARAYDALDAPGDGFCSHFSPKQKKCEVRFALGVGTAPRVELIHPVFVSSSGS